MNIIFDNNTGGYSQEYATGCFIFNGFGSQSKKEPFSSSIATKLSTDGTKKIYFKIWLLKNRPQISEVICVEPSGLDD